MSLPTLVPRVPRPQAPENEERLRRLTDIVGQIFNSLMLSGELGQSGQNGFTTITAETVIAHRVWNDKTSYGMWGG